MCFYPIADPDHVDERRKTMGLQPIADYAKLFNLAWDVEQYKKELPEIEKAAKEQKL
jgi:ribosome-associated toxin RatA of RatAB toxin-antitoxin module